MFRKKNKSILLRRSKGTFKLKAAGAWEVIIDAVENFRVNGDANQAAAIAFYAILSVIPLFILTIVAAGYFFSSNPHLLDEIMLAIKEYNPYFSGELLVQLGQMERKKQLLGWVGVLGLVWLSAMIFNSMSTALNIIFRSTKKRNFFVEKLLAISMIPMAWLVGIISVLLSSVVAILVKEPWPLPGGFELSLKGMPAIMLRYVVPFFDDGAFFQCNLSDNSDGKNPSGGSDDWRSGVRPAHGNRQAAICLVCDDLFPLQCHFWALFRHFFFFPPSLYGGIVPEPSCPQPAGRKTIHDCGQRSFGVPISTRMPVFHSLPAGYRKMQKRRSASG